MFPDNRLQMSVCTPLIIFFALEEVEYPTLEIYNKVSKFYQNNQ